MRKIIRAPVMKDQPSSNAVNIKKGNPLGQRDTQASHRLFLEHIFIPTFAVVHDRN